MQARGSSMSPLVRYDAGTEQVCMGDDGRCTAVRVNCAWPEVKISAALVCVAVRQTSVLVVKVD